MPRLRIKSQVLWAAADSHLAGYATVPGIKKEEINIIFQYLIDSFQGKPMPELPEDWIARWSYY